MIEIYNNPLFRQMLYITSILAIIYGAYIMYNKQLAYYKARPIFITAPIDSKKASIIKRSKIPLASDGYGYTLMFWMNLQDWAYRKGEWKHVMHKGVDNTGNHPQPGIWIAPNTNDLVIRYDVKNGTGNHVIKRGKIYDSFQSDTKIKQYYKILRGQTVKQLKDYSESNGTNGFIFLAKKTAKISDNYLTDKAFVKVKSVSNDSIIDAPAKYITSDQIPVTIDYNRNVSLSPTAPNAIINDDGVSDYIRNVPINRWIHVAIVVNEYASDVYIDGHLKSSNAFPNFIAQNTGDLYLCQNGGFGGMLTQVSIYDTPIPPKTFKFLYGLGPNPPVLPDIPKILRKIIPKIKFEVDYEIELEPDEEKPTVKKAKKV
jgi:hypothetical protein